MKETILYLECSSGISGDMTVAALLDLGADRAVLEAALKSLPLTGYTIEIKDVYKSGIRACDFHVILDEAHENHDHDMEYLHGGETHRHEGRGEGEAHVHPEDPSYTKQPGSIHSGAAGAHTHSARNLQDVVKIIRAGSLSAAASDLAIRIFEIVAKAEAEVHGKELHEVHFHEVGAVDSIVDIVAAAVCLDNLHPNHVVVSTLTEGCGQIRCQHGLIPVPVPAVTAIAMQEGLTLRLSNVQGELVTPTGAAIAAAIRTDDSLPEQFHIKKVGLGAGKRTYQTPGILRAMWMEPAVKKRQQDEADAILVLETNIDDSTGEALAFTMQQLFAAGALDVFSIPIYMKKNRPAWLLKTICNQEDRDVMEAIIFQNTTTIGIRRQSMQRTKLKRRIVSMRTPWGTADIKCCDDHSGTTRFYPENDSVSRFAKENGIGFSEMYRLVQEYAGKHLAARTDSSDDTEAGAIGQGNGAIG
ncbi:MAG: nickel pincer cofactor biosynthesis protein LarC [Lachnospiraceae bacterium]|nr:nickel pincer cofactor biosynthesis protein LarC [Lachnospiraceae bacterium]